MALCSCNAGAGEMDCEGHVMSVANVVIEQYSFNDTVLQGYKGIL